ncbi:hemicentin-1-like isoform X2 [Mya arenaria]|uniref:hemicentin-1-like isoform X2 n=1 Tax=Mya arenaria TaxID=6604 RepID=UPI0022E76FAA|nr:hemicentin-1-like isoform X2 [Mya arenaria]
MRSIFAIILLGLIHGTGALECYNCQNIETPSACNQSQLCTVGQSCFLEATDTAHGVLYQMGCLSNAMCTIQDTNAPGIVGRSIIQRQQTSCHECCSKSMCNDQLCAHSKPTACVDAETFDCAQANTLFSICKDVQHAKVACPRFCGLCNLVDGNWAAWSHWSPCDVTCGNGSNTRTRTCTDPAPANGGLNCTGADKQNRDCMLDKCPVHGGWSDWSSWGACSATCDVGLERRDRTCTNPKPDLFGDHCFGDNHEDRVCRNTSCAGDGARIAFSALLSTSQTRSSGQTIVFDRITVNHGNGYSSSTGQFTAPQAGTYQFGFSIMFYAPLSTDNECGFFLMKGSTQVLRSWSDTHSGKNGYSQSSIFSRASICQQTSVVLIITWKSTGLQAKHTGL